MSAASFSNFGSPTSAVHDGMGNPAAMFKCGRCTAAVVQQAWLQSIFLRH